MRFFYQRFLLTTLFILLLSPCSFAQDLNEFDKQVKQWAMECRDEVAGQFNLLLTSGKLSVPQLFDTFYIPIPNTNPQKYRTQYDLLSDGVVQPIIDKYREYSKNVLAVYIVDQNGYVPTHNSHFSKPLTGYPDVDIKINRTKRMFNDRTGLAAARNSEPYLVQPYRTDAGSSVLTDMSVPITIQGRHWGAVRVVYKRK